MTDRLCATCGEPHPWTRERGFYGADGHAFRVVGDPRPEPGELGKRYRRTGISTALLVECVDCWPPFPVLNQRVSLADHDAFHAGRSHGQDR